ncbi:hypothetical protein SDC9_207605 [bioreactor metagenome]|uniref:Transposase IS200-like domain-containing protein n=1 Tax=bioreactor metagenome TaxID=1076179 RepID=A0A645JJT0_9ZZZZ
MPHKLSYNPSARITEKVGFIITSVGSMVVEIIQTKKNRSHLVLYLAKAYPQVALARIVRTVVRVAA